MITITDATLGSDRFNRSDRDLIAAFYQELLALGVDRIELTPEIDELLRGNYEVSKAVIKRKREQTLIIEHGDSSEPALIVAHENLSEPALIVETCYSNEEILVKASSELFLQDYESVYKTLLSLPFALSFCTRNAGYAGTALTVDWVAAGGSSIVCSVMGEGGYAPLEEVLLALYGCGAPLKPMNFTRLKALGFLYEKLTGNTIPPHKPILGERIFEVESGIHIDGILKNNRNYEPFSPELVGAKRLFSLGKFSGKNAVRHKLEELNLLSSDQETEDLLFLIRQKAMQEQRNISNIDLYRLLKEVKEESILEVTG